MGYWYHFCIMFEALFIMTLIDAGTRVGRYLLQELLGHFHPKFNDQHWAPGVYGCAALLCILWGYLVLQGNIGIIWPLFGVSNQLLGTMTLAVGTTVIMRLGHKRYALSLIHIYITTLARTEGLEAHARAIEVRFEK